MIQGINHIGISTGDLDRSLAFYRDLIGMEVLGSAKFEGEVYENITSLKDTHGRAAMLGIGNTHIELFEFDNPQVKVGDPARPVCDHGITHICFEVADVHQEYERLKAAGVNFHSPPQCFGEAKATYGRDPDGNVFELLQMKCTNH